MWVHAKLRFHGTEYRTLQRFPTGYTGPELMKVVHTGDPGILSLRSDVIGCVVLAGLLLITGGGMTLALTLDLIPFTFSFDPELENLAMAAGVIAIMLGLIFVGGRSGKIIDSRLQSLVSWSGFLIPMRRKHQSLGGYSWVVLVKEIRRGSKSSTTTFPVRLEGDGKSALLLESGRDALEARRLAEAVAKVMRLPMTDSTSGQAVIREPDRLDESLRDRVRRLGERVEVPSPPHTMRSQVQLTSNEVVADLPGMSTKARLVITGVVAIFALGFGVFFVGTDLIAGGDNRWTDRLPMLLFPGLFATIPMLVIFTKLGKLHRATRVTANRASLLVIQGRKRTEIPGDELEELSISGHDFNQIFQTRSDGSMVVNPEHLDTPEGSAYRAKHGPPPTIPPALAGILRILGSFSPETQSIRACSDRASVQFGGGLDRDELAYLYSAIIKVMAD